MKLSKILCCILTISFVLSFTLISVNAQTPSFTGGMINVDGITYRTYNDGTATLYKGNFMREGEVVIPAEVEGYVVTSIGDYSFQHCDKMTGVVIPASVNHIGYSAFYGCEKLESVTIPDSVEEIEYAAFYGCKSLKTAKIADMVAWCAATIDGPYANPAHITGKLDFGTQTKDLVVPSYIESVGAYAFYGCKDITSVEISEGITRIGECAFYGCENLAKITVPKTVLKIEDGAFSDCDKLSVVNVSTDNTNYKNLAGALVEIETKTLIKGFNNTQLPNDNSIERISAYAFSGCNSLLSIVIPDCISYIGVSAFKDCTQLTDVTLPKTITSINSGVFSGCEQLKNIILPENLLNIGSNAFRYCKNLTSITLPEKITEIGDFAFADCVSLTSLEIPGSLTKLGNGIVAGSTSLTSLSAKEGSSYYSYNNCIIKRGTVWAGCKTSRIPIIDSITMIAPYAFMGQTGLTQIALPNSITDIEVGSFDGCTALSKVYYGGDEEKWNSIKISNGNTALSEAEKLYNNTDMPEILINNNTGLGNVFGKDSNAWIWLVIGAGVILIAGAVIVIFIIKRKKK
ncbi:MAG: leucine-rich repeat domain-containing protein [Clostridia bacterium]|nr:leucine-rich repeat domain-containing protein [Clostridia bacterium]